MLLGGSYKYGCLTNSAKITFQLHKFNLVRTLNLELI